MVLCFVHDNPFEILNDVKRYEYTDDETYIMYNYNEYDTLSEKYKDVVLAMYDIVFCCKSTDGTFDRLISLLEKIDRLK